jgi:hypothetical protein
MKKTIFAAALLSVIVAACGGGGSGNTPAPMTKTLKLSVYGNPLVSSTSPATAKVQAAAFDQTPSAPTPSSAAAATVQTLTDALAARGVTATVTPQVMDGTTLHQIIMGENNGLPPTNDQFKTEPSEWLVVNFQLDDMVTKASDPAQMAALDQFAQDLFVFNQRAMVAGKRVFAVLPILTCDVPNHDTASDGLVTAINKAAQSSLTPVGGIPYPDQTNAGHMGADCRNPDAYIQNLRTQIIADDLASRYKAATSVSQF